jgi:quercetin dioxygenase-like cupin family protein
MAGAVDAVDNREAAYDIVQRVKAYLSQTGMHVPGRLELEISHHYGIERFDDYGATIITFVNREYCKKLIVMLPGQKHPEQLHHVKEETFQVLQGELELVLDGVPTTLVEGDIITVERGTRHAFSSAAGCIIEEVSSTHLKEDSYYTDPAIAENEDRKTLVSYWLERSHDPRDERGDAAC